MLDLFNLFQIISVDQKKNIKNIIMLTYSYVEKKLK